MVTIGQALYNSLLWVAYNYLSSTTPNAHLVEKYKEPTIVETVTFYGYQIEEHEVKTADGYFLKLFRLRRQNDRNINETNFEKRPPALLMHGLQASAYDYVLIEPNISLGYLLFNQGYDIWMGNCRGNRYSRKHVKYHTDDSRFWQFSGHEMGYYDIPAKIDYILNKTGYESLYYVGVSQGATNMFITASERPEYIKKIRLFIAMAPVIYTKTMRVLTVDIMALFYDQVEWFVETFGLNELFRHDNKIQQKVLRLICHENMPLESLCRTFWSGFVGHSSGFQKVSLEKVLNNYPCGGSTKEVLHFVQSKKSDRFRQYDHGLMKNLLKYGTSQPPDYNLKTDLPTVLIYGDGDLLSTEQNIERISAKLKNLKYKQSICGNHADYLVSKPVIDALLPVFVDLMKNN